MINPSSLAIATRNNTALHDHEILLDRCRTAKNLKEQKRCFNDLAVFLESIGRHVQISAEVATVPPSSFSQSLSIKNLAAREHVARSVLTTWPYGQVSTDIDRILDACGQIVSISTCSGLLKEIASTVHGDNKSTISSSWTSSSSLPLRSVVQACWATIQRMLTTTSSENTASKTLTSSSNNTCSKGERKSCYNGFDYVVVSSTHFDSTNSGNDDASPANVLTWKRFVTGIILLLPQTLANACHAVQLQVPLLGTSAYFYPKIVHSAWVRMRRSNLDSDRIHSLYSKILITQLIQTRRSDFVVQGLVRSDKNKQKFDENELDKKATFLASFLVSLELVPRDMATLILALLRHASVLRGDLDDQFVDAPSTFHIAQRACNSMFGSSSIEHQETIVEQLVFSKSSSSAYLNGSKSQFCESDQRRWSRWIVEIIAPPSTLPLPSSSLPASDHFSSAATLSKHLTNIADRWSQWTFVQEVEGRQQHHVSLVLWQGLILLTSVSPPSSLSPLHCPTQRDLTFSLVNGVSHRLGSTLMSIRQDGMRIAQQLARATGQDIQFDEYLSDNENDVDHDHYSGKTEVAKLRREIQSTPGNRRVIDPDSDYYSDEEIDSSEMEGEELHNDKESISEDLSVEWEDELMPYDLDDDEDDLRETPIPLHLLEALELLRTGENHEHAYTRHEAALDALPTLIHARPDDLPDVAVSLALQLLRMEDKYSILRFDSKKQNAVRALTVEEPFLVGQVLIEQLFEEGGLSDRLNILAALQSAAIELSSNQISSSKDTNSFIKASSSKINSVDDEYSSISPSNLVSRRKRSRNQQKIIKNRFSNIAPVWFYSLIANFIKHRENDALWSGSIGSTFLTYLFRCLATIVEISGIQVSQVLANDLLDLVWDFRTADVAEVRLSVLVAVSTSIDLLSNERLVSLLYDEFGLPKIIFEMSSRDPDKECRNVCHAIAMKCKKVNGQFL